MRKNRRNRIKHILAMMLFCMVMSIGMVSLADEQGTISVKSAKIRASADPSSDQLGSAAQGKTVDIIGQTTGTDGKVWYQVYVDANTKGYIRGDLVKLKDGVTLKTIDGNASTQSSGSAAVSADGGKVTVISNKTNIREGASTSYGSVATANRGMVLTVIGETDGEGGKWYQVSFSYDNKDVTGYIRSDLVTSDNVPADAASSEINGEANPGEEQAPETMPDEEQPPEQPDQTDQSNNIITPMNVDEVPPYIMPGFEPFKFTVRSDETEYDGYTNGDFLICYGVIPDGEEGWYLVDNKMKVCQRYVYAVEGIETPGNTGAVGLIPVIVLVVIIIILVAIVGLLLLKLRERGTSYKGYDDDDDDYRDDDIEDLEELEEDEPKPVRRPQTGPQPVRRPQGGPQPVRRPQTGPSGSSVPQGGQQPMRHPQGGPQPVRRPQGGPAGSVPQGGAQPIRRPQGANPANNGGVRPQGQPLPRHPQTNTGQLPLRQPQQPSQSQNDKIQMQKGYKAKNLLDDDIDFMDIE